nr:MAG TPA: hypothetical protein [Caudoviricetes sp.]
MFKDRDIHPRVSRFLFPAFFVEQKGTRKHGNKKN